MNIITSLASLDFSVALALGSLLLSFGVSVLGLTQIAFKSKGHRHE